VIYYSFNTILTFFTLPNTVILDPLEAVLMQGGATGTISSPNAFTNSRLITTPSSLVLFPVSIIAYTGNTPDLPVTIQVARFPPSLMVWGEASAATVLGSGYYLVTCERMNIDYTLM